MHNKKNYLLLATMILMVLVGCQTANNEATNPQDTTVTSAVESTVTPEATATPSVDVTPTVTPKPTETPIAIATATPEATPTAEPTVAPTETPVPTVEPTATPVPTATSTPIPTPTPKFTFEDMDKELYAKSSVNVRSLPSTEGDKLGGLSAWEKVKVTGQCNETSWYRIEYGDGIGYVSNNYLVANTPTPTPTATPIPEYVYTELDCVMSSTAAGRIYRVPGGYPIRGGVEETFTAGTEFKVTGWCDESSCYRVEYEGGYGYEDGVGYIYEYYLTDNKSDPNIIVIPNENPNNSTPNFYSIEVKFDDYKIKFPARDNTLYSATYFNSGRVQMLEYEPGTFLEFGSDNLRARVGYTLYKYFESEELTMDWAREKLSSPVGGHDPEDFIIETEVDGRPCYIRVDEDFLCSKGGWSTEYDIYQEIADGIVLYITLYLNNQPEELNYYVEKLSGNGKYWYSEYTCNKEAHLPRVLPYLITQDQIQ